jgi:L-ascorbate metabolism protein UlaG (beta-lactamase superfamily)
MMGAAPFDGVDLVFVTRNHPDHFDARPVTRYLERSPKLVLLAPSDAVAEMRHVVEDLATESC